MESVGQGDVARLPTAQRPYLRSVECWLLDGNLIEQSSSAVICDMKYPRHHRDGRIARYRTVSEGSSDGAAVMVG